MNITKQEMREIRELKNQVGATHGGGERHYVYVCAY